MVCRGREKMKKEKRAYKKDLLRVKRFISKLNSPVKIGDEILIDSVFNFTLEGICIFDKNGLYTKRFAVEQTTGLFLNGGVEIKEYTEDIIFNEFEIKLKKDLGENWKLIWKDSNTLKIVLEAKNEKTRDW
jgi:hypothetical protein